MLDGKARNLQRGQIGSTRGQKETFAFLLMKATLQVGAPKAVHMFLFI